MPEQVVTGAMMECTFGMAPSSFIALPEGPPVNASKMAAGNISHIIPIGNIPPFGMCISPTNPVVAAATTAALGVLTPMPCVPAIPDPWEPGNPTVLVNGMPALNNTCMCTCAWGGVITFTEAGQMTVMD